MDTPVPIPNTEVKHLSGDNSYASHSEDNELPGSCLSLTTGAFCCVPGMALIQLETNQLRVVTTKYSEPQVENSNVGMEEVV